MNLNQSLRNRPVAVIGMSAMFADAPNIEEFWNNIIQAKDSVTDVPESRWRIEDYYDPDPTVADKTYCKRGGFLPDIDFDPMEFGLPPNILEVTDASQLLALIAARDAFDHAGYGKNSPKFTREVKDKTGVLLGVGGGQKLITPLTSRLQYPIWEKALRASGIQEEVIPSIVDKMKKAYIGWNENSFPGMLGNVISGRITNRFDLGGINSVVDAACAASLSAVKMALSELVEGRADMMLTGGVDTDNSPFMYMSFSKTPAFSRENQIRPFSDKADGMLIGEGLGMVVLKRLEDAERDGDTIYAVIKGVGTSSDGRHKSVYAPRPEGQAMAMRRAYEEAGYEAKTVGLIEAHGTGTKAGDACELKSMHMVFGENNNQHQHIALGSVKSQIGHTKAAAGSAGLLKAILSLHHAVLPPTLHVDQPNDSFEINSSPIYINTLTRPWISNSYPRRASVSAFGFGGINVHITLEEYKNKRKDYRIDRVNKSILLSESDTNTLKETCQKLINGLNGDNYQNIFTEMFKNSSTAINENDPRIGFVTSGVQDAIEKLSICLNMIQSGKEYITHPKGVYFSNRSKINNGKTAVVFAGQGSQYVNMGSKIVSSFSTIRNAIEQFNTKRPNEPVSNYMYPVPVFDKRSKDEQQIELTKTEHAQAAIGALSMGMYNVLQNAGLQTDYVLGHSFGELTALWAAGTLSDDQYIDLAIARGDAMSSKHLKGSDSGSMLAVKATEHDIASFVEKTEDLFISNLNSSNQTILGGSTSAIEKAIEYLKENGFKAVQLPVSAAFHTKFVSHAQIPFANLIDKHLFKTPSIPILSNSTGELYPNDPEQIKNILKEQLTRPVLFKKQIELLYKQGVRIFIEVGPKSILQNLIQDILQADDVFVVSMNAHSSKDDDYQFRLAANQLCVLGYPLYHIDDNKAPNLTSSVSKRMSVKISGNNFVSKHTQKAYYDALNDGVQIKNSNSNEKPVEKIVEKVIEKIVEVPVYIEKRSTSSTVQSTNTHNTTETDHLSSDDLNTEEMKKEQIDMLKQTISLVTAQQDKNLEMMQQLMEQQFQQSNQLINLLNNAFDASDTNQTSSFQTSSTEAKLANGLKISNGTTPSNGHQVTSNGHQNGNHLVNQTETLLVNDLDTAILDAKTTQVSSKNPSVSHIENILLEVISDKTGYPVEMLELDMDMEADLGIDSIKRVEIFGSMTEDHPEMSNVNPSDLAELRTLGQIVEYLSGQSLIKDDQNLNAAENVETAVESVESISQIKSVDTSTIESILLEVISDKTGYPVEMLELDMDMEADLGIDSIKRVEIFGSMTEDHPEMSNVNPSDLAELKTLGQIVEYLSGQPTNQVDQNVNPVQTKSINTTPNNDESLSNSKSVDTSNIESILLEVISEKTGYPVEMLELDMDMEADLGIDSIKRVEIFGSMTEDHPEMSNVNPSDLAELRTLRQIVEYLAGSSVQTKTVTKKETVNVTQESTEINTDTNSVDVENILLEVISDKTGYPVEMLELDMDMEADLGIDSIKRVEIFGSMTEDHPEMSNVNPSDLAELRTLRQIVEYLNNTSKKKVIV